MITKLLEALGWRTTQHTADHVLEFIEDIKAGKHDEERLEDGYFSFIGLFKFDCRGASWVVKGPLDEEEKVVNEAWLASVMCMTDLMTKIGAGMRMGAESASKAKQNADKNSLN